jgi:NAD(P)-dependent dehydrogenase (short-subunit alcohol dehydrogenase family)
MAVQQTFDGEVVFITGGASGIGAETARKLVAAGARVAIGDVDFDRAKALANELGGASNGAEAVMVDVSQPVTVQDAVDHVVRVFGGLTRAANCAGITVPLAPLHECSPEEWRRVQSVNLDGMFYSMRSEIPAILAQGGGAIVNIASVVSVVGVAGAAAYTAGKHGVVGLTKAAALDYVSRGIRINAVAPGYIDTPLLGDRGPAQREEIARRHPLGRMGHPGEIAEVIVFLLSPGASFITGSCLMADGGYTAR